MGRQFTISRTGLMVDTVFCIVCLKAQQDGAWLCSLHYVTDVIDKESYSNAPCIRPGAACDWASEAGYMARSNTILCQ
jgi:hypothetical protein